MPDTAFSSSIATPGTAAPGTAAPGAASGMRVLSPDDFPRLVDILHDEGYQVIAPTVRDAAIVYDEIDSARDLPVGWTDEQAPGRYRLRAREDQAYFGYAAGPHSWKRFLFPPRETLVQIRRRDETAAYVSAQPAESEPPMAFLGVRACDLAAIEVQDRVFVGGPLADPRYQARRERGLVVAVNCVEAGDLCFCVSMGTGPRVRGAFDLCLTELSDVFLIEAGSAAGQRILDRLPTQPATADHARRLDQGIEACAADMGRTLDTRDLPGLLFGNLDHARWDDVAARCLSCGNCTQACPTCFCFTVTETSSLRWDVAGASATRERSWDSCFTQAHSQIHGATFRPTIRDRYRQWLTHKLGSWHSQFGTSGCVGCGRCIAWCPVGIDITEEVAALRSDAAAPVELPAPRVTAPGRHETGHEKTDPLLPAPARVIDLHRDTADVVTLLVEPPPGFAYQPGQFDMLALPAIGEVPISISGSTTEKSPEGLAKGLIEHTIRAVGAVTSALVALSPGDRIGLRGPYGTGWPLQTARGRPVIVVAGGIGLAPLRGALREMADRAEDFPAVHLLYGTRTPDDILFPDELRAWAERGHMNVGVTVDRADAGHGWEGEVGVVTRLVARLAEQQGLPPEGTYLVCGPEIMMRFAIEALLRAGIPETGIHLSMERNMKCAAGFCGRCQYGPYFICKDGPVFRYDQVSFLFGRDGF